MFGARLSYAMLYLCNMSVEFRSCCSVSNVLQFVDTSVQAQADPRQISKQGRHKGQAVKKNERK